MSQSSFTDALIKEMIDRAVNATSGQPLSSGTKSTYVMRLQKLARMGVLSKCYLAKRTIGELDEHFKNKSTQKSYLSAMMCLLGVMSVKECKVHFPSMKSHGVLKEAVQEYKRALQSIKKTLDEQYERQEMSEKERQNWFNFEELEQTVLGGLEKFKCILDKDEVTTAEYNNLQAYVVALMYLKLPTLRNTYFNVKKANYDFSDNFIYNKEFYFCTHTKGHEQSMPIPTELAEVVEKFCAFDNGTDFMFVTARGEPFTPKTFSEYVIRLFRKYTGKNIGSQMLRKIFVSDMYKNEKTILQKKDLAKSMMHSVAMHERYRRIQDDISSAQ